VGGKSRSRRREKVRLEGEEKKKGESSRRKGESSTFLISTTRGTGRTNRAFLRLGNAWCGEEEKKGGKRRRENGT